MFQPTTFGNYFLTRRIAVGGMAEIYAAKLYGADGFEKDIVIKQILPQYARDPEFVQSFVAEAKIAVTLNHSNIAGIYELGRVDGTYFIAMELVDGLDVFTLIDGVKRNGGAIDLGLALLVVEECAKGLDYAHRKLGPDGQPLGLVHRDLSPRNVLCSREGDVKILDFGIAKTRSELAAMPKTRAGVVKGTTGYMSPEQATGGEVDARTDVYQAGLLLFELIVGEPLFWRPDENETRDLMRKHRVVRPSEINPLVIEEIDRIALAALVRDPAKRIPTAADLAMAVARVRAMRYPDASPRALGELVARVAAEQEAEVDAQAEQLPATYDLASGARIETFASAPVMTEPHHPYPHSPPPLPAASHADAQTISPPLPPSPTGTPDSPLTVFHPRGPVGRPLLAGAIMIGAAAVVVWGVGALAEKKPDHQLSVDSALTQEVKPPHFEEHALTATAATEPIVIHASEELPVPQQKKAIEKTKTREKSSASAGLPATISFGTKSCSSRVTIDGEIVARSTPSFDHKVAPGEHTFSIEGTGCPLIERPGSLKPSVPSVVKRIDVVPGARLKLIADFVAEQLDVRKE